MPESLVVDAQALLSGAQQLRDASAAAASQAAALSAAATALNDVDGPATSAAWWRVARHGAAALEAEADALAGVAGSLVRAAREYVATDESLRSQLVRGEE